MKQLIYSLLVFVACATVVACSDDDSFSTEGGLRLTFSTDTVNIDTVFSNVPSSTRSFWVYNHSGDGTRRYLCVEVTDKVDMSGRIPYKQMFAQAVAELHEPGCIYWFTSDDEREIQQHNRLYQQESAPELMLTEIFEPTNQHKREHLWTASAIQQELAKHLRASDLPNLTNLGLALKKLRWKRYKVGNARGYYLRLRPAAQ